MAGPLHRDPYFVKWSPIIRARANANPDTTCWRCGEPSDLTRRIDDPWETGHADPNNPRDLRPEHRNCNRTAAGEEHGWHAQTQLRTTRNW